MKLRHILTAAAATFALATSSAAFARDYDHDRDQGQQYGEHHDRDGDRDYRDRDDNHGWHHRNRDDNHGWYHHDRGYHTGYMRQEHRPYVSHDRVRYVLRSHHYSYVSAPYWYRGQYVVRAHDRHGRLVLVRVNPYSGAWMGVSIRL